MLWQWERVQPAGEMGWMLLQGVRADLILIGLLIAIPVLLAPLIAIRQLETVWRRFCYAWCLISLIFIIFVELSTPSFLLQYDVRPNRLYIEYLKYPKEVFSTLWHGFRAPLLLGIALTIALVWLAAQQMRRVAQLQRPANNKTLWLTWPLVVLLVFISIRSTTQHRPANPAFLPLRQMRW